MAFLIRPLRPEDYEGLAALSTVIYQNPITAESIRYELENRPEHCKHAHWVAEKDGLIVGGTHYGQHAGAYHPHRFDVGVAVHPDYRHQGIGSALYEQLMAGLQPHDPTSLTAGVKENCPDGLRFAEKRGFQEVMRTWETHLDVEKANTSVFDPVVRSVAEQGYTIRSFADLASSDPDHVRKLYDLVMIVRYDVPTPVPMTPVAFEVWVKNLENPHFYPEAYFIGMKGDEWCGLSALWKTDDPAVLNVGLTAVKREHRGTGLAKAMKVAAINQAKAVGCKKIKTWNESNNQKMLAINERLGFVRQPAWISYKLTVREEA